MHRAAALLTLLAAASATACGSTSEPKELPAKPPPVQQRKKPVWCPKQRFEQVRRDDGRYDVKRLPHGTFDARDILGLREERAAALAKGNDCSVRAVERDGEKLVHSEEVRPNRINVTVRRGYVTGISSVG